MSKEKSANCMFVLLYSTRVVIVYAMCHNVSNSVQFSVQNNLLRTDQRKARSV